MSRHFHLVIVFLMVALGCGQEGPSLVLASKMDTEGALLANMMKLVLEHRGFRVIDKIQLGGTPILRQAIIAGEIDLYPEYTGNGAFFFNEADSPVWQDAEAGYQRVKKLDLEKNDIVWLRPASANNTWAIAVRRDLAAREGLRNLTDLAAYLNRGGVFKLAASEEFVNSPAALGAFARVYGFKLRPEQLLILSGGNTATTQKAAAELIEGVNAAMAYGTDGTLAAFDLVVLEDDLRVQPVYEPAPILRKKVLDRYPELSDILDPIFRSLNLERLQRLNASIIVDGKLPEAVARDWLKSQGLIP